MKANARIAGDNWELDGSTIIVRIPMTWKRLGGRKAIIAPDGTAAWAPAKPRPDETLIRALARAHRWKGMLEECRYRSGGELAEAEKISRRYVNRILQLTLLAPDITETILDGGQAKGVQLEKLLREMPTEWASQRKQFDEHLSWRAIKEARRSRYP